MHAPPPPPPNLDPVTRTAQVRQATPEEAEWFTHPDTDKIVRSACATFDKAEKAAEAEVEAYERKESIEAELEAATARLNMEANQSVLDEPVQDRQRDKPGRSRPERRR